MYNYTTNLSFGANLDIKNLNFKKYPSLGGKDRWLNIKKIFNNQTKNDKNSYILESNQNHQGLSTIEMFKKIGDSKVHLAGIGGKNYTNLVSLPEKDIAGELMSLIG